MLAGQFLLCTCQIGSESALKHEVARVWPESRFSYSRPGFVTFKLVEGEFRIHEMPPLVFARRAAVSLGKLTADSTAELVSQLAAHWQSQPLDRLHIFSRDAAEPGRRGYESGPTDADRAAEQALKVLLPEAPEETFQAALPDQLVLDCLRVSHGEWWLGAHCAVDSSSRWKGGFWPGLLPEDAVSRAYTKVAEAIDWSRLPLAANDLVADIGCSPGGGSQMLLERGMRVIGIDPAEVDPRVSEHPRYTYLRKRGSEVKVREFRDVRWLVADMNVAPAYTLDTVERIATHEAVSLRGILLNLKMLEWKLADEVPSYLERVRSWGFDLVMARQLSHNRQEICLVATRKAVYNRRRGRTTGKP